MNKCVTISHVMMTSCLGPPLNLTATLTGNSLVQLSWIPSNGGLNGSFLDYVVLVKDGNGAVVYLEVT